MSIPTYDMIVIGSGPAGQKAAVAAAKARKRVAVIDRTSMIGGVCVHTGTIPSKAVREAIFQLTGLAVKAIYGDSYRGSGEISVDDLSFRVNHIIGRETQVIRAQLKRNGVAIYEGSAQFLDAHKTQVQSDNGDTNLEADKILIACGTRPARNAGIPFDDHRIVDTEHLSGFGQITKDIIINAAGDCRLDYASFMQAPSCRVTLIYHSSITFAVVDLETAAAL